MHVKVDADRQPNYVVVVADRSAALSTVRCCSWRTSAPPSSPTAEVRGAARVLPEGRLPVGRRLLGQLRVGQLGRARSRACCRRREYPDLRHPAHPSDPAHALRREGLPAGVVDQFLGPQRRQRRRNAAPDSAQVHYPRHPGRARPPDGDDDAQHRHRRHLGARRREPASTSTSSRRAATRSASTSCCTR